jgi:antitoxin VapB
MTGDRDKNLNFQTGERPDGPRVVRLFRHGCDQTLCIPPEFKMDRDEAMIRKETGRLIIEPVVKPNRLRELFASWEPLDEALPETADPPVEPEDIF